MITGTVSESASPLTIGASTGDTGTVILSASNSFTGNTTVSFGTLSLGGAGAISASAITVNGGLLTETVANGLSGNSSLAVSSGTAILSQANNNTGTTAQSSSGILVIGASNAAQFSTVSIGTSNDVQFGSGIGGFALGGLSQGGSLSLMDTNLQPISLSGRRKRHITVQPTPGVPERGLEV